MPATSTSPVTAAAASTERRPPRYNPDGLCAAPFPVGDGYGVCETFGGHDRHAGVVRTQCRRTGACAGTASGSCTLEGGHPGLCDDRLSWETRRGC